MSNSLATSGSMVEFLRLMQSSRNLPKTSQPPVGVFADVFEQLAEDGAQIISIHMSHALNSAYAASFNQIF